MTLLDRSASARHTSAAGWGLPGAVRDALSGAGAGRLGFALVLCFMVGFPLIAVVSHVAAPTDGLWQHLIDSGRLSAYIRNTIALSLLVGGLSVVAGALAAWLVTMHRFPGDRILEWALVLPLAMPAYILGYAYTDLLQDIGPVQTAIRGGLGLSPQEMGWFPAIHSVEGAGIVLSLALYPYVYLLARAAFTEQSVCALEVSRTLGCDAAGTFFRVALPLARPALVAGLAFVLMETLADFGTVKYFGVETLTTGVYRAWYGDGNPAAASQIATLLLGAVILLYVLERSARGARRYSHTTGKYRVIDPVRLRGWRGWAATVFCVLPILAGFVLPAVGLMLMARSAGAETLSWSRLLTLAGNSALLAGLAAIVVLFLAVAAVLAGRGARPTRSLIRLASLGYATPGVVIGIGILTALSTLDQAVVGLLGPWSGLAANLILSGTLAAVVYGHAVRFFVVGHAPLEAALDKIKPSYGDAARTLGDGQAGTLRRVYLPLMRPTLLTAGLLVVVDSMKELPATLMLRPFNFDTLSVEAFNLATTERLDAAGVPSLLIVAAGILPVILLVRAVRHARPGHRAC